MLKRYKDLPTFVSFSRRSQNCILSTKLRESQRISLLFFFVSGMYGGDFTCGLASTNGIVKGKLWKQVKRKICGEYKQRCLVKATMLRELPRKPPYQLHVSLLGLLEIVRCCTHLIVTLIIVFTNLLHSCKISTKVKIDRKIF